MFIYAKLFHNNMTYYVIIRGPAGVGKTSVAESVAKAINGVHISIDKIQMCVILRRWTFCPPSLCRHRSKMLRGRCQDRPFFIWASPSLSLTGLHRISVAIHAHQVAPVGVDCQRFAGIFYTLVFYLLSISYEVIRSKYFKNMKN